MSTIKKASIFKFGFIFTQLHDKKKSYTLGSSLPIKARPTFKAIVSCKPSALSENTNNLWKTLYYPEPVESEPNKPKPVKPEPGKPMPRPGPTLKATVSCKPSTWSEYTNNSWKTLYKRHLCYRRHERCLLLPLCS